MLYNLLWPRAVVFWFSLSLFSFGVWLTPLLRFGAFHSLLQLCHLHQLNSRCFFAFFSLLIYFLSMPCVGAKRRVVCAISCTHRAHGTVGCFQVPLPYDPHMIFSLRTALDSAAEPAQTAQTFPTPNTVLYTRAFTAIPEIPTSQIYPNAAIPDSHYFRLVVPSFGFFHPYQDHRNHNIHLPPRFFPYLSGFWLLPFFRT